MTHHVVRAGCTSRRWEGEGAGRFSPALRSNRAGAPLTEKPGAEYQIKLMGNATMTVREAIATEFANRHAVAWFDFGTRRFAGPRHVTVARIPASVDTAVRACR